jgi:hypothetical protein
MTATQVETYFHDYAAAFSRFDVDAVGDLWAYPAYMVGRGKRAVLDAEQFRINTMGLCAFYKYQGMARATKRVLDFTPLTATTASVRTADQILDADGQPIIAWEHVYLLSDTPDGIKAVTALPDNELDAWAARGTPMGSW